MKGNTFSFRGQVAMLELTSYFAICPYILFIAWHDPVSHTDESC